jgi:hypothetical protein
VSLSDRYHTGGGTSDRYSTPLPRRPEFADKHGRAIEDGARVLCEDFDDDEAIVVSTCSEDADMQDGRYVAMPASITVRFENGDEETITRTCPRWQDDDTFIPVTVIG